MIYSISHSSRQDVRIPILLVYLGHRHILELSNYGQGTGFCQWYYCVTGRGEFIVEGRRVILHPGQFMMTLPDTPFSCKAMPEGCTIHLLGFTGPNCVEILRACGLEEAGIYQISEPGVFERYVERLLRLHKRDPGQVEYSKLCYSLFLDLSPLLQRLADVQPPAFMNNAVQMIIKFLETHYPEPINLDALATEVHLTKEYMCVLFKKEMGRTILHHLTLIRIGWARQFLERYPEKKAYEIGQMCGFESPSYFGKKFKQLVGLTPDSYRRVNSISLQDMTKEAHP